VLQTACVFVMDQLLSSIISVKKIGIAMTGPALAKYPFEFVFA
jgi:hypothetical protein